MCLVPSIPLCRRLDVDEAARKLVRMMEWRQDFLKGVSPSEADVAAEAATGKAYLHDQKDVNGRPVIIVRASKHITGEVQLIASSRYQMTGVCTS